MEHTSESNFAVSQCKSSSQSESRKVKSTSSTSGITSRFFTDVRHENELKSSQISSSLDRFCRNDLNESADFIDCDSMNKFKHKKTKTELFSCEICKEDITHLDIYERGVHVNGCIDKQISSTTVSTTQPPEAESIFILECPLCFKNFSSLELRANHIKKCGRSKGLGIQAILKALELQERHALERVALGLPSKPPKLVKPHKTAANKKAAVEPKNKAQSDIQLAKAMSLSLTDTQKPLGDALSEDISVPVTLQAPTVQQNPGKKLSKYRKGLMDTPLLVLRSEEDRKKLLLDKVAAILAPVEDDNDATSSEQSVPSVEAKKDPSEVPVLWHLTSQSSGKWDYYVEQLLDWIVPSNVEVGAKLGHLSQIAGHEIVTQVPVDYTFSSQNSSNISLLPSEEDQAIPCIIRSLQSLVASPWMSDVDIHTSCGTVLPAHKLLLAIRCPSLKQDMDFCSSSGKTILKWDNTSFNAALQFLNFLYTGHLDQEETKISELLDLAKMYEVHDLEAFLNTNGKTQSLAVESNYKFYQDDHPTSLLSNPPGTQLGSFCRSQEDINTDLEIVYDCISSSLRPTQFASQQSLSSTCMKCPEPSSKSITEEGRNSPIVIDDSNDGDHVAQMVSKSFSAENCISPASDEDTNGIYIDEDPKVAIISKSFSEENCISCISDEDTNDLHVDDNCEVQTISKSFSEGNCMTNISDKDANDLHIDNKCKIQAVSTSFSEENCIPPIAEEDTNRLHIDEDNKVQIFPKPYGEENPASLMSDDDVSKLISDSPEKGASSDIKTSPMTDKHLSASPIIFYVNDSEDDTLEGENDQVVNFCLQKLEDREPSGRLEELDLNSAESKSSEDSVKILKSSPVSLSVVQKEHEKIKISRNSEFLQCLNRTRLAASFQKEPCAPAHNSEDLQKFIPEQWDSENLNYIPSSRFGSFNWNESSMLHFNSPQFSIDTKAESSSEFDSDNHNVFCNSSFGNFNKRKLNESENKSVKNMKLNSSYKNDKFRITSSLYLNELSGYDKFNSTLVFPSSQESFSKNKLAKNMHVSNSPAKIDGFSVEKSLTGEELCDCDEVEDCKLLLSSSQKSPAKKKMVKNEKISNNSPVKIKSVHIISNPIGKELGESNVELSNKLLLLPSQKSLDMPSATYDFKKYSPKRRNILPEILFSDSDSAMSSPPNSKVDFTENPIIYNISNTDSVERIRKNIASPEIACFNSDNEASPLDKSSSFQKELPSKKTSLDETTLAARNSSERIESTEIDYPKVLNMSYQSMDDFVFEEPYADFEEPDIFSPIKEMSKHHSAFCDTFHARNVTAKDETIQQEPIEQSEPDTFPRDSITFQLQPVNKKAEKKIQDTVSEPAATPCNKSSDTTAPQFYFTDSPITPQPDFKSMKTPDIKQALKRFGVKAMPRRKAVALLSHIYNETHPLINGENEASSTLTPPKKLAKGPAKCRKQKLLAENSEKPVKMTAPKKVLAPKGILLSSDSDDSSSKNSEAIRLGCILEMGSSQCTQDSPTKDGDTIEKIKKYILSNDQLHTNILMYRPLNIVTFQQELKCNGIKISIPKLMDHFDDQGVTFTYPRNEEKQKKRTVRANNFRKRMINKMSQQPS